MISRLFRRPPATLRRVDPSGYLPGTVITTTPDEDIQFVLLDEHEQFRNQFIATSHGLTFHEWLKTFVNHIQRGEAMAAALELKNITGEHLAEANQFTKELITDAPHP